MVFLLSGINRENVQGGPRLAMEPHGLTFPGIYETMMTGRKAATISVEDDVDHLLSRTSQCCA